MEGLIPSDLKAWRTKFKLSQKKLATLAKVSLATLRQLEVGGDRKPRRKTLKMVETAIKDFESKIASTKTDASAVAAKKPEVRKARKPKAAKPKPKARKPVAAKPKPKARKPKAAVKPKTKKRVAPPKVTAKRVSKSPVMITNLDLELINRILRMNAKEKLALLQKII